MPGIAVAVLSGEADGPKEDNTLSVHGGEQHCRHQFARQFRPHLWVHKVSLAFILQFEDGGFQAPDRIGVDPDEPLPVGFANRNPENRFLDAHLVREVLRQTQAFKINGYDSFLSLEVFDEPLAVRLADRDSQNRFLDAHLVPEVLRQTQTLQIEIGVMVVRFGTPVLGMLLINGFTLFPQISRHAVPP